MIDAGKLRSAVQRELPIGSGKAAVERVLKENGFTCYFAKSPFFQQGKDRTNFYWGYTPRQTFIAGYGAIDVVVQMEDDKVSEVIVEAWWIGL